MFQGNQKPISSNSFNPPLSLSPFSNNDQSGFQQDKQQLLDACKNFINLPKGIKFKITSPDTSEKIRLIGQKYNFEYARLVNISRLIREYYFGEVRFENFAAEIEKRVGVSLLTAQEITRYIKSEIIDWDPWAEYVAKLPKMTVHEIIANHPKIAGTEITTGYIELRGSEDLEEPTIKNWIHDYVLHVGQERHSQMERTEFLFHSENGRDLSSPDREKLGIILKSFDENIPLPVDEENGEIVFDSIISEPAHVPSRTESEADRQRPPRPTNIPRPQPSFVPPSGTIADKEESFIKPYNPTSSPHGPAPRPIIAPVQPAPPQNFVRPNPTPPPSFVPPSGTMAGKEESFHPNLVTLPNRQTSSATDKYFNAPEIPDIPSIKVHSITEHNEQQIQPQQNIQRPLPLRQTSAPQQSAPRPQHRIINPFEPRVAEPRIEGNIVDLSMNNDQ